MRGERLRLVVLAVLLMARPSAAASARQAPRLSCGFDAAKPLDRRVAKIPAWLLSKWSEVDQAPEYRAYMPTRKERRALKAALDGLPAPMRQVLGRQLLALYFVKNLKGNGITTWVLDASSRTCAYSVLNPAGFRKTVSQALTERERSAFRGAPDLTVDAGSDSGILYTVSHEMTHAFDYARGLTPYTDPGFAKAMGRVLKTGFDVWASYGQPLPQDDFPLRGKLSFYGFGGPNLDAAQAPQACAQLAASPFTSLYGSRSWAEDAAELFVARHLVLDLGRPYRITCAGNVYEPMKNPRVAARAEELLAPLYEPADPRSVETPRPDDPADVEMQYALGLKDSIHLLKLAADRGYAPAQRAYGDYLRKDDGVRASRDGRAAAAWYRKAAEQGDLAAQKALGDMYAFGEDVPKDYKRASFWFAKAAAQGDTTAMLQAGATCQRTGDDACAARWLRQALDAGRGEAVRKLGHVLLFSEPPVEDVKKGLELCREAAAQGSATAMYDLGQAYREGRGVPKDLAESLKWYQASGDAGFVNGLYNAGVYYYQGLGVPRDYGQALRRFRTAAEQGYVPAENNLGIMYLHAEGVARDTTTAEIWLRKAAEGGEAQAMMGLVELHGDLRGWSVDMPQALDWLRRAAEAGAPEAQWNLGEDYLYGLGLPRDLKAGASWLGKAAAQGHADSQQLLGSLYHLGLGVPRDQGKAVELWRASAAQGWAMGENDLGLAYERGYGLAADDRQAALWYGKAAEQGEPNAQGSLAVLYLTGSGVARDEKEAFVLLSTAAAKGLVSAEFLLGAAYERGLGVAADAAQARAWYRKAAAHGFDPRRRVDGGPLWARARKQTKSLAPPRDFLGRRSDIDPDDLAMVRKALGARPR